ncbi:MAG: hypothetical protein OEZ43_09930 [Gammaproteobacteria bacterium]|nr:hypothetical protein [Gammaproteobacteria bacterium]
MKYIVFAFMVIFSLVGCAPVTESSLRQEAAGVRTFTIEQPYQQVFQNLLDSSRQCFLNRPIETQFTVVGNRNNRVKSGEIVIAEIWSMAERNVFMLVDVEAVSNGESRITSYHSSRKAEEFVKLLGDWISQGKSAC